MKKIELKFGSRMLTKEQMKNVTGGSGCDAIVECVGDGSPFEITVPNFECGEASNASIYCDFAEPGSKAIGCECG